MIPLDLEAFADARKDDGIEKKRPLHCSNRIASIRDNKGFYIKTS